MGVSVWASECVLFYALWNDIKLVIAAASLRNDNGIGAKKNPFISEHSSAAVCADRYASLHAWR